MKEIENKKEEYSALERSLERRDILQKLKNGDKTAFVNLFKYFDDAGFIDKVLHEVKDKELAQIIQYAKKLNANNVDKFDLYKFCGTDIIFELDVNRNREYRSGIVIFRKGYYDLLKKWFDCFDISPDEKINIEYLLQNKAGSYYENKKEAKLNALESIIKYLGSKKKIKEIPSEIEDILWSLKPYLSEENSKVGFIREIFTENLPLKRKEIELLDAAYRKDEDLLRSLLKGKDFNFKCIDFVKTLSVKPLIDKVLDDTIVDIGIQTDMQIDLQMDCEIITKKKISTNELHKESAGNKNLGKI